MIEALWYTISSSSTIRQESFLSYIDAVSTVNCVPIIMQVTEVYFKTLCFYYSAYGGGFLLTLE